MERRAGFAPVFRGAGAEARGVTPAKAGARGVRGAALEQEVSI